MPVEAEVAAVVTAQPQLVEAVRRGWHSLNYHDPAAGFVCAMFPVADGALRRRR